jgi:hypothetical protein
MHAVVAKVADRPLRCVRVTGLSPGTYNGVGSIAARPTLSAPFRKGLQPRGARTGIALRHGANDVRRRGDPNRYALTRLQPVADGVADQASGVPGVSLLDRPGRSPTRLEGRFALRTTSPQTANRSGQDRA